MTSYFEKIDIGHFIQRHKLKVVMISVILALLSLTSALLLGFKKGIDFGGGIMIEFSIPKDSATVNHLRSHMAEALKTDQFVLQSLDKDSYLFKIGASDSEDLQLSNIKEALMDVTHGDTTFKQIESVGPQVSQDSAQQSAIAVIFAFLSILVYLIVRFNWKFAVSGVIVLLQDVILAVGFISFFQLEFSLTLVASILTIIGYCVNDTVVIYDRIRSNLRRYINKSSSNVIAISVSETLRRSIITSVVTMMSLIGIMFFSDNSIQNFAIVVIFGIVVGTINSICLASILPIYLKLEREEKGVDMKEKNPSVLCILTGCRVMKVIIANWKMYGSAAFCETYASIVNVYRGAHKIILCPPFPYLVNLRQKTSVGISIGSQGCTHLNDIPQTGQVSAQMIKDCGGDSVIIGHFEQRKIMAVTASMVGSWLDQILQCQLQPILCVSSNVDEMKPELDEVVKIAPQFDQGIILAYEPEDSIGSGQAATIENILQRANMIKGYLTQNGLDLQKIKVIYGGSINVSNAAEIVDKAQLDGLIVGSASLDPENILEIAKSLRD